MFKLFKRIKIVIFCSECRYYDPEIFQCKRYQRVKAIFQPTDFCSCGLRGIPVKTLLESSGLKKREKEIEERVRLEEMENKKQEYTEYIDAHIKNIKRAYKEFGPRLCEMLKVDPIILEAIVENHDKSKYDDIEFECFRQYFYPTSYEEKDVDKFELGFLFHENKNPHHPEYWIYRDDEINRPLPMPSQYIAEHILDMAAMSYKFGGDPYKYYKESGYKKQYHSYTRELLENILIELFK